MVNGIASYTISNNYIDKPINNNFSFYKQKNEPIDIIDNYIEEPTMRKTIAREVSSFQEYMMFYQMINDVSVYELPSVDYEADFANFLEERGCKNEEELKVIAKAGCYTMDEFLSRAGFVIQSNLNNMIAHGVYGGNVSEMKDYILNNADISDIADLLQQKDAQSQPN